MLNIELDLLMDLDLDQDLDLYQDLDLDLGADLELDNNMLRFQLIHQLQFQSPQKLCNDHEEQTFSKYHFYI